MANQLDVVNDCLAIMGEAPLNSISEEHVFKDSALKILDRNDKTFQGEGWWYNTENLYVTPNPSDSRVYLPGDALAIRPKPDDRSRYVQRGRTLYDLYLGTDQFVPGFGLHVALIRRVPFEDTPTSVNAFIGRKTVLDFGMAIDGDQTKYRNILAEVYGNPITQGSKETLGLRGEVEAEHIRNVGYNFINSSDRLSRIRRATYSSFSRSTRR